MSSKKTKPSKYQLYVDELVGAHKISEEYVEKILKTYPDEVLNGVRRSISAKIGYYQASVKKGGLKSKECAEIFSKLSTLRKIREKIKDKLVS